MAHNIIIITESDDNTTLEATVKFASGKEIKIKDDTDYSTENRIEAYLVAKALSHFDTNDDVDVYCYSSYLPISLQANLIRRWQQNGWQTKKGEFVKNWDLLEVIAYLSEKLNIRFHPPRFFNCPDDLRSDLYKFM